ncbi:pentatricopeptide repeat-containing protein At1g06710, mitochondrial [Momordica charantia]|uniref:Pentatricopeptide repeat-containing protein At1g06710, mitochondrial n=1 Tax=Momordica charantia TaxID=3673 RepID=A0A6J1DAP3_MOMCH|nr:pentatricopeptide repeat-containing protein At1g06710, mitochondrial [Momordica charantia]XP_022150422.1 pentatricopeptide repeat-containing protein At1g06710, mitochondrial [Momordica charantia]XP_022150423.1 pentatricopeptide repeat-containing protein At1g06710, mitochondrial [Momordica charantia]
MSRRGLKSLRLLSTSFNSSPFRLNAVFSTNPSLIFSDSSRFSFGNISVYRLSLSSAIAKYTTSPPDNLEGLVDLDDSNPSESSRVECFSAQEVGFLRDSLLDSPADSGSSEKTLEIGKISNEAISILDAIRNGDDGFGDKTQKLLRQFRQSLNPDLVVEVLNLLRSPELCVRFFLWAGRQIGYNHTASVYCALLDVFECDNYDRVPEEYLREIWGDDKVVLGKLLNVLIRKCCRNGLWNVALEELGRLKDFGYKPTRLTYNALIQVFLRADKLDTAHLVHREMSQSGFSMDEFTLGFFAQALCRVGKWRDALSLIEKEDFVPNTVLYTKMISGLCEASLFEEAMDFLNRMRSTSCIPNAQTYKILLCGCLNKKQLGRCKRILSMMIAEGCFPSYRIFNSLVHAYCRSGDFSYAYKLLKKMENCGCKPGYVVYNILIGGICGSEELPGPVTFELAEKAYNEMLSAGTVLNKVNVVNFARCLCGFGKFEKAYKVIHEMMDNGFIPDTSTYSEVIGFLCNASRVENAFLLFKEMKGTGVVPDVYTYTILIDCFSKAGLIKQAHNWLDEMVRDGCEPTVVTYTTLIHAYLKAKKVSIANELFELMLAKGCIPNVITYTALIDGYCKSGNIEKACQIYSRMRGDEDIPDVDMYFKTENNVSEKPNVVTFGALVDGLCKAHKVKDARNLLETMFLEGCEPNNIVYDALIDGFCKAAKLDEAQEVFAKMVERGYNPNVYTYSSLIDRLFKDKRLDFVLKVLSKMLENSCAPNVVIYTEMIDGLSKVAKTDEAYKLMLMMEEKGCKPNVVTYTAMIDGFGKAGKVDKCLELFREMGSKGCAPNFVTYTVLINHCCATGFLDEAYALLDEMKQTYWPKHISSYCKVIEGYNREFILSLGLLEEAEKNDSAPIILLYRVLIDNFIKAGRLEVALKLHKEVISASMSMAAKKNMYTSLIHSFSNATKIGHAFELFNDMIRQGAIPDLGTFVHLITGLIKVSRWEEALQLADIICQMDINWLQQEDTP